MVPEIPTPWKGHGTRDAHPRKGHGTRYPPPVDRQTPVKTLPSSKVVRQMLLQFLEL